MEPGSPPSPAPVTHMHTLIGHACEGAHAHAHAHAPPQLAAHCTLTMLDLTDWTACALRPVQVAILSSCPVPQDSSDSACHSLQGQAQGPQGTRQLHGEFRWSAVTQMASSCPAQLGPQLPAYLPPAPTQEPLFSWILYISRATCMWHEGLGASRSRKASFSGLHKVAVSGPGSQSPGVP